MASSHQTQQRQPAGVGLLLRSFRLLASLKLAVILLIILAVVLAWATILESGKGREYAYGHVYGALWFITLLGTLGVNVLAAMLIRFPWKLRHLGFLVAHVGVLTLLVGALLTWWRGIEGQVSFAEGETADSILIADRSQITVLRQGQLSQQRSTDFAFYGGPVDWSAGKTLDFGTSEGLGVKVLKFYRHARRKADWVADKSGQGGPALKLDLAGPDGKSVIQNWLPTDEMSTTMFAGPAKFRLVEVSDDSMLEDFRRPPTFPAAGSANAPANGQAAKDGVLSVHYEGKMYRVPVEENLGKKIPVGKTGVQVEIVAYLPNAVPGPKVRFTSQGDEPKNPLLELLVHLPGEERPLRQLAFARDPFLTLDGVHGRRCPVRFWYHHPAVPAQPGAEFLCTPDGKLHCRVAVGDAYQWRGEVNQGDRIETAGMFRASILKYLPHARQDAGFQPAEPGAGEEPGPEAAALVEVAVAGGEPQQVWLQRGDQRYGFQRIETGTGPVLVSFGYEYLPLDFSLKLLSFQRGMNPGRRGNASFSSSVQLIDSARGIDQQREISMNKPLAHGKFTFYQSSFQELPDGRQASILTAAHDPGRILKYWGSLWICVGTFIMFYLRGLFSGKVLGWPNRTAGANRPPSEDGGRQPRNSRSGPATDPPTETGHARSG